MTKTISLSLLSLVTFATFAFAGVAFAKQDKVAMCHHTGSAKKPFKVISIAAPAVPSHEAHGDFALPTSGDCADGPVVDDGGEDDEDDFPGDIIIGGNN